MLTADQKRAVSRIVPQVLADFFPGRVPDVNVPAALGAGIEKGRVVISREGPIRSVEAFSLGNVEGVRVYGVDSNGAALIKYYRLVAG